MNILPEPLKGLAAIKQFIACKLLPSKTRAGKTDKLPYDLSTRSLFNAHDSSYWMSFDAANTLVNLHGAEYCVGFVFTDEDPYWFIDIDNCLQPDAQWNPIAQSLCTVFKGAAIEISSSGKGLHIFGQGTPPAHSCKNSDFNLEFYHTGRFVALTGLNMIGDINFDGSHLLPWLVDNYFPATAAAVPAQWTNEAVADWRGPRDDNELIQRALKAQSPVSVFSGKASFFDLWTRNEIVLTNSYPDTSGDRVYDESSADAALAQHLAFWTGNNCDRMQRIMLQSALVREKWEREDYLPRTILNACARQTQWFCERPMETINPVLSTGSPQHLAPIVREVVGEVCLGAAKQIELFKGCVYVLDEHKILIPGGDLLKPDQFRAHFGGYSFLLDQANQRSPSRNAWEAFTESQILRMPRAVSTCFRPDLPPAEIVYRDGSSFANLWWPCDTLRVEGDASLFTEHVEKLIPNENDRAILTAYMAAVVQHQGVKFRWAPVLQGTPGNGKSLLNRCLAYAVGHKYCHSPDPAKITDQYNGWMYKSIFIGVDDVHITYAHLDILEGLKRMITEEELNIRAMYSNPTMRNIVCNFMFNCNDKESFIKTRNDRRFAMFYTPQQTKEDLLLHGMTEEYFIKLHDWFDNQQGYAIVNNYLRTYAIPDALNPARKQQGPITSSTHEAIEHNVGGVEQQILEEIAQETPGFKNGWISSTALNILFERLNLTKIPLNKRRQILQGMGYDWHPALPDGRVISIVTPDGNRPCLFIKRTHPLRTLTTPKDVQKFYMQAQER